MQDKGSTKNGNRPNIIVILVDDMGYSDIGCYGSEINTPNLNRLAREGLRFSQMYNCARCCPTRASLLTGLYPHQAGVGHMINNIGVPEYQGYLRDDCVTIAEAMREGGYKTLMSGKWHVGGHYDATNPDSWKPGSEGKPTPRQRGFDRYYGTLAGAASYFYPYALLDDDTVVDPDEEGYYFTDVVSEKACEMIRESQAEEKPFFMYLAYTAPHWPLHALPEDIARYEGKYGMGWDTLRKSRHEELNGSGILDSKWDISPRDEDAAPWSDIKEKEWESSRMSVYAAQVDRMDQGIGKVMDQLRALNIEDNTLVMFLSDNGGCAEFLAEDGHCQNYAHLTPNGGRMKVGNTIDNTPGGCDSFMSYDLPWSNASNSPFRLFKHWVHEGGISTPLIVHWPDGIQGGGIRHAPCHVVDIMATCLDVAGLKSPKEYNGKEMTPLEGESFAPHFENESWRRDRPIFWEHEGNCAVRDGEWKIVNKYPGGWELYNMVDDRTELLDLSSRNDPVMNKLTGLYTDWAERCRVLPWPAEENVGK